MTNNIWTIAFVQYYTKENRWETYSHATYVTFTSMFGDTRDGIVGTDIRWNTVIWLTEGDGARKWHSRLKKKIKETGPMTLRSRILFHWNSSRVQQRKLLYQPDKNYRSRVIWSRVVTVSWLTRSDPVYEEVVIFCGVMAFWKYTHYGLPFILCFHLLILLSYCPSFSSSSSSRPLLPSSSFSPYPSLLSLFFLFFLIFSSSFTIFVFLSLSLFPFSLFPLFSLLVLFQYLRSPLLHLQWPDPQNCALRIWRN